MVYRSAVDGWYFVVVGAVALIALGVLFNIWPALTSPVREMTAIVVSASVVLPLWLLLQTYYTVTESTLEIRSGPFRWTIERSSIRSISPTRSAVSSPALSLDRLEIRYGAGRSILVSPRDRKGFLEALRIDAA